MATEYSWKEWSSEQNDSNVIKATDCERWQSGVQLFGGTWDGSWADDKDSITGEQLTELEQQIQTKVASYSAKTWADENIPGVDGWNKVETGLITAICKPDGMNVNIYPNSNTDVSFTRYGGTTYEVEQGVTVEEWGATDANRFYGTGGTENLVVYKRPDSLVAVPGQAHTLSVYIKNNSENRIRVAFNGPATRLYSGFLEEGEAQRVVLTGIGEDASQNIQFQVLTYGVGDTFDFTWWHPKIELADEATDWTPCPTDYGYPSSTLSATPQSVEDGSDTEVAPGPVEIE